MKLCQSTSQFSLSTPILSPQSFLLGWSLFFYFPHSGSITISSDLVSKFFIKQSPICVFIFHLLKPLQSSHASGHDANYLDKFWNCSTKVSCQASDPHFLVTKRNIFFPSDVFLSRISYLTVYFTGPQDTLQFRLCTTFSSIISTMALTSLPCEFIQTVMLTYPGVLFVVITSHNFK